MRGLKNRTDGNQTAIMRALRDVGACVVSMSGDTKIGFDLLVMFRSRTFVVEVKDGSKPPSARKLTENEQNRKALVESVGVPYNVVTSAEEALALIGAIA